MSATYRIQRKDDDSQWFTLALRDITIERDSQARKLVREFTATTGGDYRAQVKHGRTWINVLMN